jgi:hypothetical protein
VTESVETAGFKSGFAEWSAATDFNFNKFNKDAVKQEDQPIDVQNLLALKALESAPVDDGSGETITLNKILFSQIFATESVRCTYAHSTLILKTYIFTCTSSQLSITIVI